MSRRILPLLLLAVLWLVSACQDVVQLDVPESPPEAVVNGTISDTEPAQVTVTTTDAFFESSRTPRVADAEVRLFENDSLFEVLQANTQEPGAYFGLLPGTTGNFYHLEVIIPEGYPGQVSGVYQTQPEELRPVSQIDSMNVRALSRNTSPNVLNPGDYALLYFRERAGEGDIFRINRWLNDSLFRRSIITIEDEGFDGQYFGDGLLPPFNLFGPFEDFTEPGQTKADTFVVRFESITPNYASFLQIVSEQTSTGTPFDAPPALIIGNVFRQGQPQDFAFGYFNASAYSRDSVIRNP
jgi:hypothetical protein